MHAASQPRFPVVPALAAALALALLVAPLVPALFPAVLAAWSIGACGLALVRRPSRRLAIAVAGLALWLSAGLAGAWFLRSRPLGGLLWVLVFLYLLPLPIVPWLYHLTFGTGRDAPADGGAGTP
jgi:hypothetical protein